MEKSKLLDYDFQALFKRKGYAYFTGGSFNLNIIGVRSAQGNKVTNRFDDWFVVIYKDGKGVWQRCVWAGTTEPGLDSMMRPVNRKGAAIMVPGQYRGLWQIGIHNGKYRALVQRKTPVKVFRDNNRDKVYDMLPRTVESGVFGINMHRASRYGTVSYVGKYSAGCQVFATATSFDEMMKLADKQVATGHGKTFTYTLIREEEM